MILNVSGKNVLVDESDLALVAQYNWHIKVSHKKEYAVANVKVGDKATQVRMHRLIMNPPAGMEVDHIDSNSLNNQRSNLRICTRTQNQWNKSHHACKRWGKETPTSIYKGVSWDSSKQRWTATIAPNRKPIYLGLFRDEVYAAIAYDFAAVKYFGEFAKLNFLTRESMAEALIGAWANPLKDEVKEYMREVLHLPQETTAYVAYILQDGVDHG